MLRIFLFRYLPSKLAELLVPTMSVFYDMFVAVGAESLSSLSNNEELMFAHER